MPYQTDHARAALSGLRLGRLLQDCRLINEHQLMDALQVQAACGGRLGYVLIKRGCLTQEQLTLVLETRDAIRVSSLAPDMLVTIGAGGATDGSQIGFAVTLAKTEVEHSMPFPAPPVRAHRSFAANVSRDLSIRAFGLAADGFRLVGEDGASIPYQVSVGSGFADPQGTLEPHTSQQVAAVASEDERLRLELRVDPADMRAVPIGRFCDTLQITLA